MSWLNAEAARLLALKTFNPSHTHTYTHTRTPNYPVAPSPLSNNSLSLAKEGKKWRRTCHTYFYRFHFNAEKANASRLKPPPATPPVLARTGNVSLASALLACLHQIGKASSQPASKKKGFIMAICLNSCACPGTGCGEKEEGRGKVCSSSKVCVFFLGISFSLCALLKPTQ